MAYRTRKNRKTVHKRGRKGTSQRRRLGKNKKLHSRKLHSRKLRGGQNIGANCPDPNFSIYNTNFLKLFPYKPLMD
jgi:hypothetical protein